MQQPNPYSTSTNDDGSSLRMVCGRTKDLGDALSSLVEGKSLTLFGERRIGKTLFLWLLRDIVDGSIGKYAKSLLDKELELQIAGLRQISKSTNGLAWVRVINLQSYTVGAQQDLLTLLAKECTPAVAGPLSLSDFANSVSASKTGRKVIALDEIEVLFSLPSKELTNVFRQFKAIIESHSDISFIFAGADSWLDKMRDTSSPLYGTCSAKYLIAPNRSELQRYLLLDPLSGFIVDEHKRQRTVKRIMDETDGKPYYCQSIAYEMVQGADVENAIERAERALKSQIDDYFRDAPPPRDKILQYLSHHPKSTAGAIAYHLSLPIQDVNKAVMELEQLGKLSKVSKKFQIAGQMFERYGKTHLPPPPLKSVNARTVFAAICLLVILCGYAYCHPSRKDFCSECKTFSVVIHAPETLEPGEEGDGEIYLESKNGLRKAVVLQPMLAGGQVWPKTGNRWIFEKQGAGLVSERRELHYYVPAILRGDQAEFALWSNDGRALLFQIPLRSVSLLGFYNGLAGAAAFLATLVLFWGNFEKLFKSKHTDPS
jgi:hypothetical protein